MSFHPTEAESVINLPSSELELICCIKLMMKIGLPNPNQSASDIEERGLKWLTSERHLIVLSFQL